MPKPREILNYLKLDVTGPLEVAIGINSDQQVVVLLGESQTATGQQRWKHGEVLGDAVAAQRMLCEQSAMIMRSYPPEGGLEGMMIDFAFSDEDDTEANILLPDLTLKLRELTKETVH